MNAEIKSLWRSEREEEYDESRGVLRILQIIDNLDSEKYIHYFTRNFLLDVPEVTLTAVQDLLGKSQCRVDDRQERFEHYMASYHELKLARNEEKQLRKLGLDCSLDGQAFQ